MDSLRRVLPDRIQTQSSTEQYLKAIQLLHNMFFEDKMPEDPSWIRKRAKKIVASVSERYENPGSRRTCLAPFLAICRKLGYGDAYIKHTMHHSRRRTRLLRSLHNTDWKRQQATRPSR
jgi:hypothetical protein